MKKILGVSGSTRKNATEVALALSLEAARQAGVDTEMVLLREKKVTPCIHCDRCIREEFTGCVLYHDKDDMDELLEKTFQADGMIVASPVFGMNPTPQLSAFFSRFRSCFLLTRKQPEFFSYKVGGAIAVGGTRNGGQEMTIQAIHSFYHTEGFLVVGGGMGVYAGASVWSQDDARFSEEVDPEGSRNARKIGERVARTVLRLDAS